MDDRQKYSEWFMAEVNKGAASADAGRLAAPERIKSIFDKHRTDEPREAKSRSRD